MFLNASQEQLVPEILLAFSAADVFKTPHVLTETLFDHLEEKRLWQPDQWDQVSLENEKDLKHSSVPYIPGIAVSFSRVVLWHQLHYSGREHVQVAHDIEHLLCYVSFEDQASHLTTDILSIEFLPRVDHRENEDR